MLLDVQMPELTGLDVVRTIGAERMPPVIFVTAHDRYALRAFELAAVDYLLKPFVTAASTAHGSPGDSVAIMRGCADSIQLNSDENLST